MSQSTALARGHRAPLPHRRGVSADVLGALAVLSGVAVVALWVMNQGGPLSLGSTDRALGSLGLLSGLLASDLMILQVVLLARIPWVERAWGHDLLTRRHRWIGFASFWLMIAHVALFALERVTRDPAAALQALTQVFVTDPWMLSATVGTLLLVLVVVTSIRAARRRLRYESWHLLHLYSYAGIAASFPHTLTDGADFHQAWTRVYWWSLYGFAFAVTLLYRLALPVRRSLRHRLRVESIRVEAPGVVSVTVTGHRLERMRTASGQFFIWRFLDGPGWTRGHPYTLSAAPAGERLRITVKAVGDGGERAARLTPGTRVLIEGPYGTFTARRRTQPRMLMIAAGIGITPLRALLEDSDYAPGEATLLYRYSEDQHAVLIEELRALAARRGVELIPLPGPRGAEASWQAAGPAPRTDDAQALGNLVPDVAHCDVYACGPPVWLTAVRKAARGAGAHRDHVHTEEFGW